jgi:hypothetical protein
MKKWLSVKVRVAKRCVERVASITTRAANEIMVE